VEAQDLLKDGSIEEHDANTRLIASAPALLEALKVLLPLATDAHCIRSAKWSYRRDKARAAIALSEGGK
jgi:hypothetical protein